MHASLLSAGWYSHAMLPPTHSWHDMEEQTGGVIRHPQPRGRAPALMPCNETAPFMLMACAYGRGVGMRLRGERVRSRHQRPQMLSLARPFKLYAFVRMICLYSSNVISPSPSLSTKFIMSLRASSVASGLAFLNACIN